MDRLWKEVRELFKEWDVFYHKLQTVRQKIAAIRCKNDEYCLLEEMQTRFTKHVAELRAKICEKPLCMLHFDAAIRAATGLPADVSGLVATYVWEHRSHQNMPMIIPRRGFRALFIFCPCWCYWTLPEPVLRDVDVKFLTDGSVYWSRIGQGDLLLKPQDIPTMHNDSLYLHRFIESMRPYLCDKSKTRDAKLLTHEFSLYPSRSSALVDHKAYELNTAGFQPLLDELARVY
jgi:hypothetical protein